MNESEAGAYPVLILIMFVAAANTELCQPVYRRSHSLNSTSRINIGPTRFKHIPNTSMIKIHDVVDVLSIMASKSHKQQHQLGRLLRSIRILI